MSEQVRQLLRNRFEPRRAVLRGTITAAPLVDGRSAGYVVVTVAGQSGVTVRCNPDQQPPLTPGDTIDCQAYGSPSATWYYALNRVAGARMASGMWEFTQETSYNGDTYQPGDQLLGSTLPGMANWKYVYDSGHWRIRSGVNVRGCIGDLNGIYGYAEQTFGVVFGQAAGDWIGIDEANGIRMMREQVALAQWREREIVLGESGQPQLRLSPGSIDFLGSDGTVKAGFDGTTRSVFGFDRWGLPLGPALEIGPTDDGRYGQWLRGRDNVPFAALLSGTEADPDNVYWRIGAPGAAHFMEFANGNLEVRGTIGGWTIEADRIRAGNAFLQSSGALNLAGGASNKWILIDASQANFPISAGGTNPASNPFRVDWYGGLTCTSVTLLSGSTAATVINVTGNDSSGAAIQGTGGKYGIRGIAGGYSQGAGVYGQTSGGTGSAGVYGYASSGLMGVYGVAPSGSGCYGEGSIGVYASGTDTSLQLAGARMNANGQNIEGANYVYVARLYIGDTGHYLYLSGNDLYWYNGSTGVKLN